MSPALLLDLALALIALAAMAVGWRQGAVASALSIVGVVAGGVVGFALAPEAMDLPERQALKLTVGLALIVLMVVLGNAVGSVAGQSARNAIRSPVAVGLDSGFGAVLQAVTALLVAWMIAIPMAATVPGAVGDAIRGSRVLGAVDEVAPARLTEVPALLVRRLDVAGMRPAVVPFQDPEPAAAGPADPAAVDPAVVDLVRPSVVRVLGEAPQCSRLLQGTGFVAAPGLVVTNAHVVAGVDTVRLDTVAGTYDAAVVHFDPEEDVAVLRSTDLPLPALRWAAEPAEPGADAVVLGFPESGPFTATPARVEDRLRIRGPDIYSAGRIEREAYVLRADVRQGNSGGPLLAPDGTVLGVIFGAGIGVAERGYALTAAEATAHLGAAGGAVDPVDTMECVAH